MTNFEIACDKLRAKYPLTFNKDTFAGLWIDNESAAEVTYEFTLAFSLKAKPMTSISAAAPSHRYMNVDCGSSYHQVTVDRTTYIYLGGVSGGVCPTHYKVSYGSIALSSDTEYTTAATKGLVDDMGNTCGINSVFYQLWLNRGNLRFGAARLLEAGLLTPKQLWDTSRNREFVGTLKALGHYDKFEVRGKSNFDNETLWQRNELSEDCHFALLNVFLGCEITDSGCLIHDRALCKVSPYMKNTCLDAFENFVHLDELTHANVVVHHVGVHFTAYVLSR